MEVTRQNFKEALSVIGEAIEDSSFIAIDAEFTGLTNRRRENALDTCDERYHKLINGTKDFMIVQFGICTFSWNEEQQLYIAKPFNFYIFPRPFNRQMPDMRFLCQSSSLEFLANQGFDFNKWIHCGIPFLLPPDEERLRQMMISHSTPSGPSVTPEAMPIPPAFAKTIELIMKKVNTFMENPEGKTLSLSPSTPFVRKLVYSHVQAVHNTGLYLEVKTNEVNEKFIMITKCSEQEKKEFENKKCNDDKLNIEQIAGFARIVRLLSQSGKVILGHNMLLDLLHTIRLFICPLPADLDAFKALVRGVLPRLIDTKVMATTEPLQGLFQFSHLEEIYKTSSGAPFTKPDVLFAEGFGEYENKERSTKAHEAGYDAYMTGSAFLAMASFLSKQRDGSNPCAEIDAEIIAPFINKIFLFPRMEDIPYLNLAGRDLIGSREHVFHLLHPQQWQFSDIQKLFKDFGYVYITKVDGTSAFVSLAKRERAKQVLEKLQKSNVVYQIQSYTEYHRVDRDNSGYDVSNGHAVSTVLQRENTDESESSSPCRTASCKRSNDEADSDTEDGELPDSPEPSKKKLKGGEHTFFEEPEDW